MSAILVLGATGHAGRGVVAAATAAGRAVIAVARTLPALRQLRAEYPRADLTVVRGSLETERASCRLASALRRLARPIAAIVVTLCNETERGRLLERPVALLRQALDANLLVQVNAARHLLPLLSRSGGAHYLVIGGPEGERPWAGYGQRAIVSASLRMLARVLHEEAKALAVRVQLLAVESPLRHDDNLDHACDCWPTPQAVGRRALQLIDAPHSDRAAIVRFIPLPQDTSRVDTRALVDAVLARTHQKDSLS